jgi:hypothetical protein
MGEANAKHHEPDHYYGANREDEVGASEGRTGLGRSSSGEAKCTSQNGKIQKADLQLSSR